MTTNNTFSNQKREGNNTFSNLTEQWKKGELEDGEYYIKSNKGDVYIDICADGNFMFTNYRSIEEVLGEVPDYTIWRNYVEGFCDEHEYNLKLLEENQQLKDLLKRCRDFINYEVPDHCIDDVLIDKINEVLK